MLNSKIALRHHRLAASVSMPLVMVFCIIDPGELAPAQFDARACELSCAIASTKKCKRPFETAAEVRVAKCIAASPCEIHCEAYRRKHRERLLHVECPCIGGDAMTTFGKSKLSAELLVSREMASGHLRAGESKLPLATAHGSKPRIIVGRQHDGIS